MVGEDVASAGRVVMDFLGVTDVGLPVGCHEHQRVQLSALVTLDYFAGPVQLLVMSHTHKEAVKPFF